MTSDRQIRANRANARNSTGPRTAAGLARASGNARRHGLTAPLPWPDVVRWYRLILNDPDALPEPGVASRPEVLQLAEAEAHLERCRRAERLQANLAFERALDGIDVLRTSLKKRLEREPVDVAAWEFWLTNHDGPIGSYHTGAIKTLIRRSEGRPVAVHNKLRILRRYRKEAETRHRKALRNWLEAGAVAT